MLSNRNSHSVVGQLYFKNKLRGKAIRFVVTRGRGGVRSLKKHKFPLLSK